MVLKCIRPPTFATDKVAQVHVFDLDRTLALSNTSLLFAQFLKEEGVISRKMWLGCVWGYLLYRLRLVSMENQMRSSFRRFFQGRSVQAIEAVIPLFWEKKLSKSMREDLCAHLLKIQKKGHVTAIYSASGDFLVEWIARKLQVHFVLASECLISPNHQTFLGMGTIASGLVKARAVHRLRYRFPKASLYGYSDSIDDSAFLESVDHPYLVSPDNRLKLWAEGKSHVLTW